MPHKTQTAQTSFPVVEAFAFGRLIALGFPRKLVWSPVEKADSAKTSPTILKESPVTT
jgi:hypothetical protein